mmetsp:Transcript_2875/g.8728  ORF Transcript_2875/g.8728 Transcript_2875/m.8728 type:complete len:306 (-) Transcript_2875:771-1688(-)
MLAVHEAHLFVTFGADGLRSGRVLHGVKEVGAERAERLHHMLALLRAHTFEHALARQDVIVLVSEVHVHKLGARVAHIPSAIARVGRGGVAVAKVPVEPWVRAIVWHVVKRCILLVCDKVPVSDQLENEERPLGKERDPVLCHPPGHSNVKRVAVLRRAFEPPPDDLVRPKVPLEGGRDPHAPWPPRERMARPQDGWRHEVARHDKAVVPRVVLGHGHAQQPVETRKAHFEVLVAELGHQVQPGHCECVRWPVSLTCKLGWREIEIRHGVLVLEVDLRYSRVAPSSLIPGDALVQSCRVGITETV